MPPQTLAEWPRCFDDGGSADFWAMSPTRNSSLSVFLPYSHYTLSWLVAILEGFRAANVYMTDENLLERCC